MTNIQAQQSKIMKTIAKLEKNQLEMMDKMKREIGLELEKHLSKHFERIQPNDLPATIQQTTTLTTQSTEQPTFPMLNQGQSTPIETINGEAGTDSEKANSKDLQRAFRNDSYSYCA